MVKHNYLIIFITSWIVQRSKEVSLNDFMEKWSYFDEWVGAHDFNEVWVNLLFFILLSSRKILEILIL